MALPKTLSAYRTHISAMDQAQANTLGAEIHFPDHAKAVRFRQMCYQARKIYHEQTGNLNHWAGLVISLDKGSTVLRISQQNHEYLELIPLNGILVESPTLKELDRFTAAQEALEETYEPPQFVQIVPSHDRVPVATRASGQQQMIAKATEMLRQGSAPTQGKYMKPDPDIIRELPSEAELNKPFELGDLE